MRLTYDTTPPDGKTMRLAEEIVSIVIKADVTYKKAIETLDYAQRLIENRTRPVM